MLSHRQTTRCGYLNSRANAVWLISPHWTGERIDYRVHGSFCALGNTMPDILGCLRSVPRHVGCPSGGSRLNSANGDGDGENDRKECFPGTKVSLPPAPVRLPTSLRRASTTKVVRPQRLRHSPATKQRTRFVRPLVFLGAWTDGNRRFIMRIPAVSGPGRAYGFSLPSRSRCGRGAGRDRCRRAWREARRSRRGSQRAAAESHRGGAQGPGS